MRRIVILHVDDRGNQTILLPQLRRYIKTSNDEQIIEATRIPFDEEVWFHSDQVALYNFLKYV